MYIYKEVLSVSNRKGRDIREFAQQGGIYKNIQEYILYSKRILVSI